MPSPWENENQRELLRLLIGETYGPSPEAHIDQIRADKKHMAAHIGQTLEIRKNDVMLELGSGCGFITAPIALIAKHVHACDVSRSFLEFARLECSGLSNVTFHHVEEMNLSVVPSGSIDAAFANSVFIHFNLFDVYWHLTELARVLRVGGRLWFDIASSDGLDVETEPFFLETARDYKDSPSRRSTLMQWVSRDAVISVAKTLGFLDKSVGFLALMRLAYTQKRLLRDVRREILLQKRSA